MLLSIITVAFRNLEGIVKTHASLAHLAQGRTISASNGLLLMAVPTTAPVSIWKISMVSITYTLSANQITVSTTP